MGMSTALLGGLIGAGLGMAGNVAGSLSQNQQMIAQGQAQEAQAKALRQQSEQQRRAAVANAETIGERKTTLRRQYDQLMARNNVQLGAGNVSLARGSAAKVAEGNANIFAEDIAENSYQKAIRFWEDSQKADTLKFQADQAEAQADYLNTQGSMVAPTLLKAGLAGASGFMSGYALGGGNLFSRAGGALQNAPANIRAAGEFTLNSQKTLLAKMLR